MPTSKRDAFVHFWDMDHTVLDNDCQDSWKQFLIDKGLAPATDTELIRFFGHQYEQGVLDGEASNAFMLRDYIGKTTAQMEALAQEHFDTVVRRHVFPEAFELVRRQREAGRLTCLITATNRIIAEPVAAFFGFPHLIATDVELQDGVFTGRLAGAHCLGAGKLPFMAEFCGRHGHTLAEAGYYGDSTADIAIMEAVGHPVAVNPMLPLRKEAEERGWPILSFAAPASGATI